MRNIVSFTRRDFLAAAAAAAPWILSGCAGRSPRPSDPRDGREEGPFAWEREELALVGSAADDFEIVVRGGEGAGVLRRRARPVTPGVDLDRVAARMEKAMLDAPGVGLAGPQVGLSLRVATLMLDYKTDHPRVVFVRNPVIVERSDETADRYEGCLSIPGVGGLVRRSEWIRIEHETAEGEKVSTEAEAHNAVLWQHELDHLDGVLYVDRLLGELLPMEEVRRLRREMEDRMGDGDEPARTGSLWGGETWHENC